MEQFHLLKLCASNILFITIWSAKLVPSSKTLSNQRVSLCSQTKNLWKFPKNTRAFVDSRGTFSSDKESKYLLRVCTHATADWVMARTSSTKQEKKDLAREPRRWVEMNITCKHNVLNVAMHQPANQRSSWVWTWRGSSDLDVTCDVTNQSHDQERPRFLYGRRLAWQTAGGAAVVPHWGQLPEPSEETWGLEPGPSEGPGPCLCKSLARSVLSWCKGLNYKVSLSLASATWTVTQSWLSKTLFILHPIVGLDLLVLWW